ncbi:MAG: cyclase family protein [Planctomycetota bacterium]|nr:cyclase family protein [Planctomycetota bacterium]
MRKIIDLTHPMYDGLEAFPGNQNVKISPLHEIDQGGYRVNTFLMDGHTGTHIDVPWHVFPDGETLEKLDLGKCIGPAFRVSLPKGRGEHISPEELKPYEEKIVRTKRLILATGWSSQFGGEEFYVDFPGVSIDAARWLVDKGVVLLGLEQPSVHPDDGLEVHHILLEAKVAIVEAIAWPQRIPSDEFELICLPLAIRGGNGAPTRTVAVVH